MYHHMTLLKGYSTTRNRTVFRKRITTSIPIVKKVLVKIMR